MRAADRPRRLAALLALIALLATGCAAIPDSGPVENGPPIEAGDETEQQFIPNGPVAGAGLSIALLADLAIAADDAQFTLAYARIGASPDGSATWSLPRIVGLRKALELALLAETIDAAEALRLNLVNRVVPREHLEGETAALAARLAAGPALAYGRIKQLMRTSFDRSLAEQLAEEAAAFTALAASADFAEGVSAFVGKRPPRFTGR